MPTEILIIAILILLNGVFAGAEIAVLSVRKTRLVELIGDGRASARAVHSLRAQPERFLATVQVGITVIGTTAAAFGGDNLAEHIEPLLAKLPVIGSHAPQVALALVVAAISYFSLIFGELVPKSLALRAAERYALVMGRPLLMLAHVARPLIWLLTTSSNAALRIFGDKTSFTEARLSPDELQELVEEAGRVGSLDAQTSEIASRALEFRDLTAAAVAVPRTHMVTLPVGASPEQVRQLIAGRKHSRIPVYEDNEDNIIGYVAIKDLLAPALDRQPITLRAVMRPIHLVPGTMRAADLLRDLQASRSALAIVIDETGAVSGLVTTEDLLEEIVGELFSEQDPEPAPLRRDDDGSTLVPGAMPVRDVNRELLLGLPEGEGYSTLAGLCIHLAGEIPKTGDKLTAPDGTSFEIADASPRGVRSVRVRPLVARPSAAEPPSE